MSLALCPCGLICALQRIDFDVLTARALSHLFLLRETCDYLVSA